jgi:hypothetical protein
MNLLEIIRSDTDMGTIINLIKNKDYGNKIKQTRA